jgi:hypothetical protein
LFDLDTDPDEATNLVGDAASGEALDRLTTAVAATVGPTWRRQPRTDGSRADNAPAKR